MSAANLSNQLSDYEKQMFLEIYGEDGLMLLAR